MNTVDAAARLDRPSGNLQQWWWGVTALLAAVFFLEAVFAGAMLSGFGWARKAHAATAMIVIASTFIAGLVAMVALRRRQHGMRFALTLLALAAVALAQAAVGALSAKGAANLVWLHVPLGVALVGLAAQTAAGARKLGDAR